MNGLELFSSDKKATMSSIEIADLTGKLHKNVLADIDKMLKDLELEPADFSARYKDAKGEERRCYNLPKRESLILASGYNTKLRAAIIDRWAELESKEQKPLSFEEMVIQTLTLADTRIKSLESKIKEDKPMVDFANAIKGTTSNIDVGTFAKVIFDQQGIDMGRNKLMKWLRDNKYITKHNKPYQSVMDRGLLMLREGSYIHHATNELLPYTQVRVTGKGQIYFLNKLIDEKEA
jgi:phage antirepressor YoqD-like protein